MPCGTLVGDDSLTGGYGAHGLVKFDSGVAVGFGDQLSWLLKLAVADFYGDRHFLRQFREGEPCPVIRPQTIGIKGAVGADGNGIFLHILGADIDRFAHGKSQPLPLSQGVADCPLVVSHNVTGLIQEIALGEIQTGVPADKADVIPVGNKANILAVMFPGGDEAMFRGNLPHLGFGQFTQREADMRHLFLVQRVEKIGLIFGAVRCLT